MDGREDAASSSRKVQNNLFRGAVTRTGTPASAAEGLASKKKAKSKFLTKPPALSQIVSSTTSDKGSP